MFRHYVSTDGIDLGIESKIDHQHGDSSSQGQHFMSFDLSDDSEKRLAEMKRFGEIKLGATEVPVFRAGRDRAFVLALFLNRLGLFCLDETAWARFRELCHVDEYNTALPHMRAANFRELLRRRQADNAEAPWAREYTTDHHIELEKALSALKSALVGVEERTRFIDDSKKIFNQLTGFAKQEKGKKGASHKTAYFATIGTLFTSLLATVEAYPDRGVSYSTGEITATIFKAYLITEIKKIRSAAVDAEADLADLEKMIAVFSGRTQSASNKAFAKACDSTRMHLSRKQDQTLRLYEGDFTDAHAQKLETVGAIQAAFEGSRSRSSSHADFHGAFPGILAQIERLQKEVTAEKALRLDADGQWELKNPVTFAAFQDDYLEAMVELEKLIQMGVSNAQARHVVSVEQWEQERRESDRQSQPTLPMQVMLVGDEAAGDSYSTGVVDRLVAELRGVGVQVKQALTHNVGQVFALNQHFREREAAEVFAIARDKLDKSGCSVICTELVAQYKTIKQGLEVELNGKPFGADDIDPKIEGYLRQRTLPELFDILYACKARLAVLPEAAKGEERPALTRFSKLTQGMIRTMHACPSAESDFFASPQSMAAVAEVYPSKRHDKEEEDRIEVAEGREAARAYTDGLEMDTVDPGMDDCRLSAAQRERLGRWRERMSSLTQGLFLFPESVASASDALAETASRGAQLEAMTAILQRKLDLLSKATTAVQEREKVANRIASAAKQMVSDQKKKRAKVGDAVTYSFEVREQEVLTEVEALAVQDDTFRAVAKQEAAWHREAQAHRQQLAKYDDMPADAVFSAGPWMRDVEAVFAWFAQNGWVALEGDAAAASYVLNIHEQHEGLAPFAEAMRANTEALAPDEDVLRMRGEHGAEVVVESYEVVEAALRTDCIPLPSLVRMDKNPRFLAAEFARLLMSEAAAGKQSAKQEAAEAAKSRHTTHEAVDMSVMDLEVGAVKHPLYRVMELAYNDLYKVWRAHQQAEQGDEDLAATQQDAQTLLAQQMRVLLNQFYADIAKHSGATDELKQMADLMRRKLATVSQEDLLFRTKKIQHLKKQTDAEHAGLVSLYAMIYLVDPGAADTMPGLAGVMLDKHASAVHTPSQVQGAEDASLELVVDYVVSKDQRESRYIEAKPWQIVLAYLVTPIQVIYLLMQFQQLTEAVTNDGNTTNAVDAGVANPFVLGVPTVLMWIPLTFLALSQPICGCGKAPVSKDNPFVAWLRARVRSIPTLVMNPLFELFLASLVLINSLKTILYFIDWVKEATGSWLAQIVAAEAYNGTTPMSLEARVEGYDPVTTLNSTNIGLALVGLGWTGLGMFLSWKFSVDLAAGRKPPPGELTRMREKIQLGDRTFLGALIRTWLSIYQRINVNGMGTLLYMVGMYNLLFLAANMTTGAMAVTAILLSLIPSILRGVVFTRCTAQACCKPKATILAIKDAEEEVAIAQTGDAADAQSLVISTEERQQEEKIPRCQKYSGLDIAQLASIILSNVAATAFVCFLIATYILQLVVTYFLEEAREDIASNNTAAYEDPTITVIVLLAAIQLAATFPAIGLSPNEAFTARRHGEKAQKAIAEVASKLGVLATDGAATGLASSGQAIATKV